MGENKDKLRQHLEKQKLANETDKFDEGELQTHDAAHCRKLCDDILLLLDGKCYLCKEFLSLGGLLLELTDKCKSLYSAETHLAKLGGPQKATPLLSSMQRRLADPGRNKSNKNMESEMKSAQGLITMHINPHTVYSTTPSGLNSGLNFPKSQRTTI